MNIANLVTMRFIGFDVDSMVRVPETDGAVFAIAQTIVSITVKTSGEDYTLVLSRHVGLLVQQTSNAHLFSRLTREYLGDFNILTCQTISIKLERKLDG